MPASSSPIQHTKVFQRSASSQDEAARVEEVLGKMTTAEKAAMLAGVDDWHIRGVPEQGIPALLVADCGHGVTVCGERSSPATCFPTGIGMASTWNEPLMEEVGRVLGRECLALGVSVLLGPKLNLHRVPLNGRSFETFSEDPVLAGRLGGAIIRGIQEQGVGACVKALACNNQQKDQHATSVEVDEVTLRELYLRVFEIAIEEGTPCSAMTSYNMLRGEQSAESSHLIRKVLKNDWSFPGFVVSDWRAVGSAAAYRSGLDLEMPGPGKWLDTESVKRALREGQMQPEDLDDHVRRILRAALRYARDENDRHRFEKLLDAPSNRDLARTVAEESIVLLKNEAGILPLDRARLKRLAVIGPNAASARLGGGGSASVTPFASVSPLDGIRAMCGDGVEIVHEEGCGLVGELQVVPAEVFELVGGGGPGIQAEFFNSGQLGPAADASWVVPAVDFSWGWAAPGPGVTRYAFAARFRGRLRPRVSGRHRFGLYAQEGLARLYVNGSLVIEEWDDSDDFEGAYATQYRTVEADLQAGEPVEVVIEYAKRAARAAVRLEWEEPGALGLMDRAVSAAKSADAVVLCAGLSNLFEGGSVDRASADLPAAQVELIKRIVAVNPRTVVVLNNGGPVIMPWEPLVPAIIEAWYPGQAGGEALAGILFGEVNPSGRLPDTIPRRLEDHAAMANYPGEGGVVHYREGLFVGYRHFDGAGIAPHYPFGFGLSYTTFEIGAPQPDVEMFEVGADLIVNVPVANTGARDGCEVVQVYLGRSRPEPDRPPRTLEAFQKVFLEAGERKIVQLRIPAASFRRWSPEAGGWVTLAGTYEVSAGSHSRNLRSATVEVL